MRSLTLRIKNDHKSQSPRVRVMVAEDGLHRNVLRPAADDGTTPLMHTQQCVIGGHQVTIELKITPGAMVIEK
jgi:hypothetical protein